MLATVWSHYETSVLAKKRRAPDRPTTTEVDFLRTRDRLMAIMAESSPHGPAARVAEFDLVAQRALWRSLHHDHGCSAKSISIYMSYLAAAIRDAARPRVVIRDGKEVETSIISSHIYVEASERRIAEVLDAPLSQAREWVPTTKQLAAFIDSIEQEHLFRYVIIALNTWARPEAICDLNFRDQIDMDHGLINLLPIGRQQTSKFRPTIPLTNNLRAWALIWDDPYPIRWCGEPVASVKKGFAAAAAKAGLHHMTRYTLRHYMATTVRRQRLSRGRAVTREQRSAWLGHQARGGSDTTSWYESHDPDWLAEAREATDKIVSTLATHCTHRHLIPDNMDARSGLTAIAGGRLGR